MTSIPLRIWIEGVIETIDVPSNSINLSARKSAAIASDSYLFAALKIACSLADQILSFQTTERGELSDDGRKQQLPIPGSNWAGHMVVHISKNNAEEQKDDDYIVNNTATSYCDVVSAELLPCKTDDSNIDSYNESSNAVEIKQIYALGIVFYELFSGGERRPSDDIVSQFTEGSSPSLEQAEASQDELFDRLNVHDDMNDNNNNTGNLIRSDSESFDGADLEEEPNKKKFPGDKSICLIGVPASICNLISNMINCLDCDADDIYKNMYDIRYDLQFMIDRPKFLYDLDIGKLTVDGLQLNEFMFGRETEFSTLQSSYSRCISGDNECGAHIQVIVGPSGVGKSVLAHRFGSYVSDSGGLFLSGKFDLLKQTTTPLSALASALNEYMKKIPQDVTQKLRTILGEDVRYMLKLIPSLTTILGEDDAQQAPADQDCVDAQKRLQYLLCQLFDVIATFSQVVLFLDDIQWADETSISAIKQILMHFSSSNTNRRFYFLASSRDMCEGSSCGSMLSEVSAKFGINMSAITLDCFDEEMTNMMVSDLFCLLPRLTRALSKIIHNKTQGNPLFFSQLIISLCRDELVRLSLSRRRWVWDEEKIQQAQLPDDVASFLSSTIERLPKDVQEGLFTLSCFGAQSKSSLIATLEERLDSPITKPLNIAVSEGLLNNVNDIYNFGHDWIQETSYHLVKPEDRFLLHFKYGTTLAPYALAVQDDELLFIAASQINIAGPKTVENDEQNLLVANLNLVAGIRSMELSDFISALSFLDNGISFLRKGHWKEHYDLSLKLFEAASKCAVVIGDHDILRLLSEQIQTFGMTFEDKLNSVYYQCVTLIKASEFEESGNLALSVLAQLGEEIPEESCSQTDMINQIEETKAMLEGYTDEELLNYMPLVDHHKVMAMKFYGRCEVIFHMIKPWVLPIITLKMVQLSISQGMSPLSPVGFVHFGKLIASLGYFNEACRYADISRKLLDKAGTKEVAGEIYAMSTSMMCFREPVQSAAEFYTEGITTALAAGDTVYASLNGIFSHHTKLFYSNYDLQECKRQFEYTLGLMTKYGNFAFWAFFIEYENWYIMMMGADDGTNESDCHALGYEAAKEALKDNPHFSQAAHSINFIYMAIHFIGRDYEQMADIAKKYFVVGFAPQWTLLFIHTHGAFFSALVAFWVFRKTNEQLWADRGQKGKLAMQQWAESCQHNFQHKAYLLEAEEKFCNKDFDDAKLLYANAISSAKKHRFIYDEALAYELAGYFYMDALQDKDTALQYFIQAHVKYDELGAVAKSKSVFDFAQSNLGGGGWDGIVASPHIDAQNTSDDSTGGRKRSACS